MKPLTKTLWIIFFAIAMGYLESAVVVYLRAIYYPEGFNFPLKEMAHSLVVTEILREAATIVMILAVSMLVAKHSLHRFAWFLVVFGTWDITYYVFLKVLVGWPASLFTTDILFLLPSIWTGPVIAPVINSLSMLLLAGVILIPWKGKMPALRLAPGIWILLIAGSFIVLIAYMKDFAGYMMESRHPLLSGEMSSDNSIIFLSSQFVPRSFDWLLYGIGVGMHLLAIFLIFERKGNKPGQA